MAVVQVTVDVAANGLPDDEARAMARALVEGRGLSVTRVSIKAQPDRVKTFIPKAGKPGSVVMRTTVQQESRAFHVWADAPDKGALWLVPTEQHEGDLPVYLSHGTGLAYPYHADGSAHASRFHYEAGQRVETPCQHKSHSREAAAA